jgi:glycosyltransferase involved in cell wall biosynthesis
MRHLHDAGFRFTFLSPQGTAFDLFKKDVEYWEDTEFVESPSGNALSVAQTVRNTLKHRRFDLIHSQGLFAGTVASAANYFRRIPHFITLHDVIVPLNDVPGRFKALKKAVAAFVTRRATVIIPVSKDCEMNHRSVFPSWNRGPVWIQTIPNGIDVERILRSKAVFESNPAAVTLRSELGLASDVVLGGFFGRFMPQKGFEYLIEALALLAEKGYGDRFRLVATADLHGYQQEYINAVKQRPEIARMVHFIPVVGDITPLLCQVDALIMPSLWEACCLLPMEAMVLGVPVIGSDCIGLREVIADTPSFAPKHADAESLAETLIAFTDNPAPQAARQFAETAKDRFDVRRAVAALLDLYQDAVTVK